MLISCTPNYSALLELLPQYASKYWASKSESVNFVPNFYKKYGKFSENSLVFAVICILQYAQN